MVPVPHGLGYASLYLPELVSGQDVYFISVAKMKTHCYTLATLSMKNLVGLRKAIRYHTSDSEYRFGIHERGIHQAILDLNSIRPIHFAVVDAIWAMEGFGPVQGMPVRMNTVLAGQNALAVDRVCLKAMGIPPWGVQHLSLAASRGMGPKYLSEIQIVGDLLSPRRFLLPETPPAVSHPWIFPRSFAPTNGQTARFVYWLGPPGGLVRINIVRGSAETSELAHFRSIQDWTEATSGPHSGEWDGRDDSGELVKEPGFYALQIQAKREEESTEDLYSTAHVHVRL